MEKIKVVVVEDEFAISEDIRTILHSHHYDVTGVFERAESALTFIVGSRPDLVLADIRLLGMMDGIEMISHALRSVQFPVIFITANSDQATYEKARETKPHAFLIKPFTHANLLAAIDLALFNFSSATTPERIQRSHGPLPSSAEFQFLINQSLFIRENGKYKKLLTDSILFVGAAGSYIEIQTDQQRHTLAQNLSTFFRKTPLPNIVRIHRSYAVNIGKVDSFEESCVYVGNHKLPLSEQYRSEFLTRVHCL
jgi:DNA-binding LytR/AlgR family response regulator